MRKIILYITASLDQRIAEPDGGLEWLTEFANSQKIDYGYKDLLVLVDTVIIGGRAYRELLNMDTIWPYPQQMTYVVSRHNWTAKENINFITENVTETIAELRNQAGKDILLAGGSELISMLLSAGLIDEMQIVYIPVVLGQGIPLFSEQRKESKWKFIGSTTYNSRVIKVDYIINQTS